MNNDAFERALSKRLAKLSTMPVEMGGVEEAVKARLMADKNESKTDINEIETGIPAQILISQRQGNLKTDSPNDMPARVFRFPRLWRTAVGIAASIVLVAIVGMTLLQSRPAQASLMVQLHRDIVAGKIPTMKVESLAEVNAAFAAFGEHGIQMNAPDMHVMSCCMQNVGNKQVYCVLLNEGHVPVTLTIADLSAVSAAGGAAVAHNGEAFHVAASAELTMVTVDRGGHRLCLIGALPAEKLMGLAEGLKF
jgi:hypothetical protein